MDHYKIYKWLDFFSESYRITQNDHEIWDNYCKNYIHQKYTLIPEPIFGSFFFKKAQGLFRDGLVLRKLDGEPVEYLSTDLQRFG